MAKAAVPAVSALLSRCVFAAVNSMINGVQIGTITYSFKQDVSKPGDIIPNLLKIGLSEVALMSDDGERLAGAPSITSFGFGARLNPQQQAAVEEGRRRRRDWRTKTTEGAFDKIRQLFDHARIRLRILCYNMRAPTLRTAKSIMRSAWHKRFKWPPFPPPVKWQSRTVLRHLRRNIRSSGPATIMGVLDSGGVEFREGDSEMPRILTCLLGVLIVGGSPVAAQHHPDLSGYWELRYDSMSVPAASLTAQGAAGTAAQSRIEREAIRWCNNLGVPFIMGDRAPLDIRQSSTVIGIIAKAPSSTRYIYTDGRTRPAKEDYEPTTNGYSIGHWEGDTLVVDTVGFNDRGATSIPGGGVRTADSHLIERYRLLQGSNRLSVTFTWEDPKIFQMPQTYEFRYYKTPLIGEPRVYPCDAGDSERGAFLMGPQRN